MSESEINDMDGPKNGSAQKRSSRFQGLGETLDSSMHDFEHTQLLNPLGKYSITAADLSKLSNERTRQALIDILKKGIAASKEGLAEDAEAPSDVQKMHSDAENLIEQMKIDEEKGPFKEHSPEEHEADKNAEKILSEKPLPNFDLLRIRFAIDGGYYAFADSLIALVEISKIKPYEVFELDYRKARSAHLQGNLSLALDQYYKVILYAEKLPETYFVPNSYLQIGYLKLEQNDSTQAKMYFNKVLEFKNHPYKNSLDSKAKIAIEAINASGG